MKALMKHLFYLSTLLMLAAGAAQAASITVDAGGLCTLADAITAANTDTGFLGGCPAGSASEADIITLMKDVTLTAALPEISSAITIEGNGHRIDGNNDANVGSVLRVTSSGNLTLNKTTVTGGNVTYDGSGGGYSGGGGICNYGTVKLTDSTVSGNSSLYQGGGIFNTIGSIITLTSSTVSGNSASGSGGGIYNEGHLILTNSTVSGNMAQYGGGGGINNYGMVTLTNSTVRGNTASIGGGGIRNNYIYTLTLRSSIISGNTATAGKEVSNAGLVTADSRNVFGHSGKTSAEAFSGFTPGASDVNAASDGAKPTALAAILNPLADNGGPTKTHALVAGSPAIDLDAACSTGLSTDQRGVARPATGCDAGSFEGSTANHVNMAPIYKLLLK